MNTFETPQGKLTLNRYPIRPNEQLRAWDAADDYTLQHLQEQQLPDKSSNALILNDSFGALFCCGANGDGSILITENATGDTLAIDSTFNGSTVSYSFCMGNATGIDNDFSTENFNVYPNPNNGTFNISSSSKIEAIMVYDVLGKVIYSNSHINENHATIQLEYIEKGIYFTVIKNDNQTQEVIKIIVE